MQYGKNGDLLQITQNGKFAKDFNYDENGNYLFAINYLGEIEGVTTRKT